MGGGGDWEGGDGKFEALLSFLLSSFWDMVGVVWLPMLIRVV